MEHGIIIGLEQTYHYFKEQHVAAHIEFDMVKQSLTVEIQYWKGQYETSKIQLSKPSPILLVRMNNLKEFEYLLLDNTQLKV